VIVNASSGDYRTSCAFKLVEARRELLCKDTSDSDASSVKSEDLKDTDSAAKYFGEIPDITKEKTLEIFIKRSCEEHNVNPDHIIVYRDGVGDSMLEAVRKTEVLQCKDASKASNLIFTVCQKNIHTRFLIEKPNGEVGNPPAGTIVQDAVREIGTDINEVREFFLIPTKCSLSTTKPVRYVILHNDKAIPMKEFQSLTFGMCHVYPNWTDSIKLPFPTQLAHKMAFQMGESQIAVPEVHKDLYKTYFYL